jgi:hypothetical protein
MLSSTPFPLHSFTHSVTLKQGHKYLKRIMIISFHASSGQIRHSFPNREPEDMEIGKRKVLHILRLNKTTTQKLVIHLNIILILCKRLEEQTRKHL